MFTILKWFLIFFAGILVGYLLLLILAALWVNPKKQYRNQSRFYRALLNSATALALKLTGIHLHVKGMEKLPEGQKILFVGNHVSNFDPIVTWYAFRKWDIGYISKPENFKIPVFGRIIRKCCFLPIDRQNPRKAITTINYAAELLKEQKVSIGVYPEGTRSKSGGLLPFHSGVFKIAQKAESAVAVVYVHGTEQVHNNVLRRATDVYVDVLEVIPKENVKTAGSHMVSMAVECLLKQASEG